MSPRSRRPAVFANIVRAVPGSFSVKIIFNKQLSDEQIREVYGFFKGTGVEKITQRQTELVLWLEHSVPVASIMALIER